jgi:TRAP-type mannitol/chloroaromatic compound transport system permease small subunit
VVSASPVLARGLDAALAVVGRIARLAIVIGGAMVLLSAFMIAIDVVLRRVLGLSTWGADELSYYALAISSSWAFAYAMLVKAHIRIDAITTHLRPPLRAACDVIALVGMGFFAITACQAILDDVLQAWSRGETSITTLQTPIWIPQGLWLAGFVFFVVVTALLLLRVLVALLVESSFAVAERYGGAGTIQDETDAAMEDVAPPTRGPG